MVNPQLIEYVRTQISQGYNQNQLYQFLLLQGYPQNEVMDAINIATQEYGDQSQVPQSQMPQTVQVKTNDQLMQAAGLATNTGIINENIKEDNSTENLSNPQKKLIILAGIAIIIIGIIIGAFFLFKDGSVCGNGIVEEGENPKNCCEDTGCKGEQTCEIVPKGSYCKDPDCGYCSYMEEYICKKYECCENEMCSFDEICYANVCQKIECGECQNAIDHVCVDIESCDAND
jgi:hypothetical protein